jgi:acetyl-CoA acetyltransferase
MGQTSAQGEAYWRVHVEAWRASGRSRADYCTAHGLSRKTFGWWAWRLDRQATAAPGAHFLPVEITGVGGPDEVAVTPPTDDTRIEIALPDGVTVRVGRGVDGEALRRVLTALGR